MTPSQIIKFFLTILLVFWIARHSFYDFLFLFFVCTYGVFLESLSWLVYQVSSYQFLYGIMQCYKVVYLISLFFFLKKFIRYNDSQLLIKYLIRSGLIYALILLATTALGINNTTYDEDTFGTKGVFASGNGLSIYLGFCSAVSLWNCIQNGGRKKSFIILMIASTLVGTKASIVFLFLNLCVLFYYSPKVLKFIALFAFFIFLSKLLSIFYSVFDVIIFRFNHADSLFSFLASSRDVFVEDAFSEYDVVGLKALKIFFGNGAIASFRSDVSKMTVFDTLENDFFDIFFMYGCIVLDAYLCFQIKYLCLALKYKQLHLAIIFFCICFYSLWAGHTVFNSMSGTGLVVVPIVIYAQRLKKVKSVQTCNS